MEIRLNDAEIRAAIFMFINQQGISTKNKEVDISLIAGRSGNGHSALVDIREEGTAKAPARPPEAAAEAMEGADSSETQTLFQTL